MRTLLLAALTLLALAQPADATCHFCSEQVVEDCTGRDASPAACADSAAYLATHYPQHLRDDACAELRASELECL